MFSKLVEIVIFKPNFVKASSFKNVCTKAFNVESVGLP